jgi:exosome complex RNA-binding protein Rrp42 (RNase PH superfamily)
MVELRCDEFFLVMDLDLYSILHFFCEHHIAFCKQILLFFVRYIDALVINNDGNLSDAAVLAVQGALRDLRLPQLTEVGPDDDALPKVVAPRQIPVVVGSWPVAVSFGFWGEEKVLADPTGEEEEFMGSSLTVAVSSSGTVHSVTKLVSAFSSQLLPIDGTETISLVTSIKHNISLVLDKHISEQCGHPKIYCSVF